MYDVYVAGDLFDFKHITGNFVLAQSLEKQSNGMYKCILPQNWEGAMHDSVSIRIIQADLVLFNFDGTDLGSGTTVEFHDAYSLPEPLIQQKILPVALAREQELFNISSDCT